MKKVTRILALALSVVMCLSLVVGCGKKDGGNSGAKDTLVVGYSPFSSKFSPFFSETAYDQDVYTMTALGLLTSDRTGAIVEKGIKGETRNYNGTDYTYYGPADMTVTENPTERGVQFVTWEWDFDREGVHHGHYFQDDYDAAKRDFTVRGGLVPKDALFEPEQLAEIYRALAFVREQDETLSCGRDRDLAELMEQVGKSLPEAALRQRDAPERGTMTMK